MANFAPKNPPKPLHIAIGIAIAQIIFPVIRNKHIEPKFVARFTNLAVAEACKKSIRSILTKATMKKVPVAGPIKPSYIPTTKAIKIPFIILSFLLIVLAFACPKSFLKTV